MTPPLLFVEDLADAAVGRVVVLPAAEARHAASALRMRTGETVLVADGAGHRVTGELRVEGSEVEVDVRATDFIAQPDPLITVVQALAKGEHGELAVDVMTQAGVDRIVPWSAQRSIAQWRGERADKSRAKWQQAARSAAKQSRRAWIPEIAEVVTTMELIGLVASFDAVFVLHESATTRLAAVRLPESGRICLVVGPEGGIADDELVALVEAGAQAVALGDSVLRASLAGAMGIGVLSTRLRWADSPSGNVGGSPS